MRDGQLLTNSVRDSRIITALEQIRREAFVPAAFAASAYVDKEIPLGRGRYMTEPLVFATLLEMAHVQPNEHVLLIGAGTGYSAAVLSCLSGKVTAVESDTEMFSASRANLKAQSVQGVELLHAPLEQGGNAHHGYDVIFIDGGVQKLPETLCQQLTKRGRLVGVEVAECRPGTAGGLGQYLTVQREHDIFSQRREGNAFVAILPGFTREEGFRL